MAEFQPAFDNTMDFEDPARHGKVTHDAGGRTRFGIANKFHPDLPEEFFTGPVKAALAEAEELMESEYWELMHLAAVEDQNVANKLFDMAVNMGTHQAGIYAQRACNAALQRDGVLALLVEDGKIGPMTLNMINALPAPYYIDLLKQFSESHYRHIAANHPDQAGNLNGWLKRAEA